VYKFRSSVRFRGVCGVLREYIVGVFLCISLGLACVLGVCVECVGYVLCVFGRTFRYYNLYSWSEESKKKTSLTSARALRPNFPYSNKKRLQEPSPGYLH